MARRLTFTLMFCSLLFSCETSQSGQTSIYEQLASLEYRRSPTPSEVGGFQVALERLHEKCPGDPLDRLAEYAYFLKKELVKAGHEQTILASITAMDESIPDGQTMSNCHEIAAALIILAGNK